MDWQREESQKIEMMTKSQTEILEAGASFYGHL